MTVRDGKLIQLSVSEVESFDPAQYGGCPRRWWFERAADLRPEQNRDQTEGEAGHALLADYFTTGERPKGRPLMGKAVMGAIVKGELPTPGPDLLVEERFDGQPKHDPAGRWLPLDVANTLHLAGVPFDGFIDLAFRRGDVPEIWDHKFFTPARPDLEPDPYAYCKKGGELIRTVQMPVYVLSQIPYWPDARRFRIVHHYVSKKGVDSLIRPAVVELDQVLERRDEIVKLIETMKPLAAATDQRDVPHNRRACSAWRGCPHQSICSAHKERNTVQLTPEEAALFADLPTFDETETPEPAPVPAAPAPARRHAFVDAPADEPAPTPAPSSTPAAAPVACACGTEITAENGSRLSSGEWKHIGCKLNAAPPPAPSTAAAPAAPAAEPKPRRGRPPKSATPAAVTTPPAAAPASTSETLAEWASAVVTPAAPAPTPIASTSAATISIPVVGGLTPETPRTREALAALLENLAVLVRSAA